ncbi:MAG: hypothetical protein Q4C48_02650 [Lachnospiraceae bacterium]|nr:hypothetical protein [Lachnospiraceae bacterium]
MLTKKNDWKVTLFRAILIITFLIGLFYVIQFISLGIKSESMDEDEFLKSCGRWANTYYLYLLTAVLSLVFSIVCFHSTGKVVSVIRTFFLFAGTLLLLWATKTMNIFKKASGVDFDDSSEVLDMYREVNRINDDEAMMSVAISLCVIVIFFVLFITSVFTLVKRAKNKKA